MKFIFLTVLAFSCFGNSQGKANETPSSQFETIKSMFANAEPPEIDSLLGIYSTRCYFGTRPTVPVGFVLITARLKSANAVGETHGMLIANTLGQNQPENSYDTLTDNDHKAVQAIITSDWFSKFPAALINGSFESNYFVADAVVNRLSTRKTPDGYVVKLALLVKLVTGEVSEQEVAYCKTAKKLN